jgi:hypothetical protein
MAFGNQIMALNVTEVGLMSTLLGKIPEFKRTRLSPLGGRNLLVPSPYFSQHGCGSAQNY